MLQEQQVKNILLTIAKNFKASANNHKKSKDLWGDAYEDAVELAKQIEVHSEIGEFPEELMIAKAPNETAEELAYRKACYESITVPYWHRAENSTNRIWASQNHRIDYVEDDVKQYFTEDYPIYGNVLNFFQSVVSKQKIRDPNAVLCLDFDVPLKEDGEGNIVVDQSVELKPYACIYEAKHVLMYEDGVMALLLSDEKSEVQFGNDTKMDGIVCYLYDTNYIYRIKQVGKKVDWKFESTVYYQHDLGYMPAWKLKGIPYEVYEDNPVYQSYFIAAVPHLNKAVKLDSTLDASINKIAYPTRAYFEQDCPASGCNNGLVYDGNNEPKKCTSCGGTGKTKFSPLRDYVHKVPSATETADLPFPAFAYVSPDSGILTFNAEKIDADIIKAFTFINIDMSSAVNANGTEQTATQIRIDREEFYSFLLTFSNEIYDLFYSFVYAAIQVRYGREIPIVVSPPKTFDLITAQELTTELANANIPEIAKRMLTSEYLSQRFSQQSDIAKRKEVIDFVDPYSYKTTLDIIALKNAGIILPWQFLLHEEINSYIDEAIDLDGTFLDKAKAEIKAILVEKAKEREAEVKAASANRDATSILNSIATG